MSDFALLLNADSTPLRTVSWKKAISYLMENKAFLVLDYAQEVLRSVSAAWPKPAVIQLYRYDKSLLKAKLSRENILARDAYQCQYCGLKPRTSHGFPQLSKLSIDHVIPRAYSFLKDGRRMVVGKHGKPIPLDCWANLVTCCHPCNSSKAGRTPKEANMELLSLPKQPDRAACALLALRKYPIPEEWKQHLPPDSPWIDYWSAELDQDQT